MSNRLWTLTSNFGRDAMENVSSTAGRYVSRSTYQPWSKSSSIFKACPQYFLGHSRTLPFCPDVEVKVPSLMPSRCRIGQIVTVVCHKFISATFQSFLSITFNSTVRSFSLLQTSLRALVYLLLWTQRYWVDLVYCFLKHSVVLPIFHQFPHNDSFH